MTPHPLARHLRICQPWQARHYDPALPELERIAFHEAGHVVLMQDLLGLDGMRAQASEQGGEAHWPPGVFDNLPEPSPDESGILAATAAAVFHAGVMAEQIRSSRPWTGPVFYLHQTDFQRADEMLRPKFGRLSSAAHGYAQHLARHVLESRWERVEQIAQALIERGEWQGSADD